MDIIGNQIGEDRQEQLEYLAHQVNCLEKSIDVENVEAEEASIENTGSTQISEIQLNWTLEDNTEANRVMTNLDPGEYRTAQSGVSGNVDSFQASIIGCMLGTERE